MTAPKSLRLAWRHTWPEGGADFTASIPNDPDGYARVYRRSDAATHPDGAWYWTATAGGRSAGAGYAGSKRAACEAAEGACQGT